MNENMTSPAGVEDHPVETTVAVLVLMTALISAIFGLGGLDVWSRWWELAELATAVLALAIVLFGTRRRTAVLVVVLALVGYLITASMHGPDVQGPPLVPFASLANLLTLCACALLFMPRVSRRAPIRPTYSGRAREAA